MLLVFVIISTNQQEKNLKSISKFSHIFLTLSFLFLFWGCKTTNAMSRENFTPEAPYHIEENVVFNEVEEPYKFIFLRIYNPVYKNPFYYANVLKNLIRTTEVTEYTASHASIGFSLDDSFYGLSATGQGRLKIEHCTDIEEHPYMKNCDPVKSDQLTLAIKVRESEYYDIKEFVETAYNNPDVKYDVGINFPIGAVTINRKFFSKRENKQFGSVKYPKRKKKKVEEPEEKFVCCTFIAYSLISCVPEYKEWFNEHNIDYHYLTVTDLIFLPNAYKLFYSSWDDYDLAATAFAEEYPEFLPYLNN